MSVEVIRYAFVAGEISPTLFGRTDLEKYDLGLAKCHNFFIDYKGGISTRPGTIFIDYIMDDARKVKLFPFQFDTDIADTYLLLFGNHYVRFLQNGAYVEEQGRTVTGMTNANPGRLTVPEHGYQNGDWVRMYQMNGVFGLNGRLAVVSNKGTNEFNILDEYGRPIATTNLGTLDASTTEPRTRRIYTLTSPYSQFDLEKLRADQIRDTIRLTHPDFKPRNLIRFAADDWVFVVENMLTKGDLKLSIIGGNPDNQLSSETWQQVLDSWLR